MSTFDKNAFWWPKDHIGQRDHAGRRAAHALGGEGQWLRKHRFGAVAKNLDGKLEVKPQLPTAYDGWYSLGRVADGSLHVQGSIFPYGPYSDRGKFLVTSGFANYSPNEIYNYGQGWGCSPSINAWAGGGVIDFNGKVAAVNEFHQWRTYNGKKFEELYKLYSVFPRVNTSNPQPYSQTFQITRPSRVRNGKTWTLYRSALGCIIYRQDLAQYVFTVTVDKGDGQAYLGNTITRANQLAYEFLPHNLGPRTMYAMGKYLRPEYSPPGLIDEAGCPGYDIFFSYDNGENWEIASSTDFFKEFNDTVVPLAHDKVTTFNEAVSWLSMGTAPISLRYALVIGLVPYIDGGGQLKVKVKLGMLDSAAKTVFETLTLYDDIPFNADAFAGSIFPVPGGAIFTTKPGNALDPRDNPRVCHFTSDGVVYTTSPPMLNPFPTTPCWLMGSPFPISPEKIAVAVWDGKYSLYESRDRGGSWARKGQITDKAPAPVKIFGAFGLTNFASSTQLRESNGPGPIEPSIPWAGDEAYPAPVL